MLFGISSRVRRRDRDAGWRSPGESQLPERLPAEQGMRVEDHSAGGVSGCAHLSGFRGRFSVFFSAFGCFLPSGLLRWFA